VRSSSCSKAWQNVSYLRLGFCLLIVLFFSFLLPLAPCLILSAHASESLLIAASPSVKLPLEAISRAFERAHPGVRVRLVYETGLDLRQRIAAIENRGEVGVGSSPVHLVAPVADELLERLESKYYVLPGTRRSYASTRLVLVVPQSLVDAPESFESLAHHPTFRVAIADSQQTEVGRMTQGLLASLGLLKSLNGRLDVAVDGRGVLDHVMSGQADAGIVLSSTAAGQSRRVRIAAVAPDQGYDPPVHSIAMERNCPNRSLCEEFLTFVRTEPAQEVLRGMGYGQPANEHGVRRDSK